MNARAPLFRSLACLGLLAAMPLAGCDRGPAAPPPLAGAKLGGPFHLIDQNGRPVTEHDYAGRYRAMYFGYTFCPDVCPTDLQKLMQGYLSFAERSPALAARLVPIFVTIDPARDTSGVMKQYAAAFGPQLIGLTGSAQEIAGTAKAYGAFYSRQPAPAGATGYLMEHSRQTILFGPDGGPIALVPTDDSGDAVAAAFARWVR